MELNCSEPKISYRKFSFGFNVILKCNINLILMRTNASKTYFNLFLRVAREVKDYIFIF